MAYEHFPRHHDVLIGTNPSAEAIAEIGGANWVGGFQSDGQVRLPLLLLIENLGDYDFTFALNQSNDNGVGDAFAAINIRNGGSAVASVLVKPRGRVVVSCETLTKPTFAFLETPASGSPGSMGRIVLTHMFGKLDRLERPGIF